MGDVLRAKDEILGRTVAIKVLAERYAQNEEFQARFMREAQTAASLTGEPFVVAIHDVGENEDGLPFIVMEYAPGGTVAERVAAGPLEPEQALRWLDEAGAALDVAHSRGIVHRDVKPANLLLSADETIRVSDFGIARASSHDTLTLAGTVLGSSGYMAPEQARGEPTTAASDRYALACVAFELLTGRRPFERETVTAEAMAHASEPLPSATALAPSLPPAVDAVLRRGLAKSPAERPATCAELVSQLRDALRERDGTTLAAAPVPFDAPTRIVRHAPPRRRGPLVVGAAVLVAAGVGAAWALASMGDGSQTSTVVLTETLQGETVERTVTTEAETVERTVTSEGETVVVTETGAAEEEPTTVADEPPRTGESGRSLNDRGFQLLQQGDVAGALPVLEQAVAALEGDASITEAYASYNLAIARLASGQCGGVTDLLARSEEIQGKRKEIDRARREAERRCDGD
jgi:serine/threonine-protein kinase